MVSIMSRQVGGEGAATGWTGAAIALLEKLDRTQGTAMDDAAAICALAIGEGGLVHLFGTGHSRMPVEEMFPRYGSYPGFHPMVELSLVSGVGQPAAYAMVVLAEDLRARAADAAVRARVQAELGRLLQEVNRELAAHERLHMIVVSGEPWSIENGFLTPTMKIRRSRIEAAVAHAVPGWYSSGSTVHWA